MTLADLGVPYSENRGGVKKKIKKILTEMRFSDMLSSGEFQGELVILSEDSMKAGIAWVVLVILSLTAQGLMAEGFTDFPIIVGPNNKSSPRIDGDFIAWSEYSSGDRPLYGKFITGGSQFLIASSTRAIQFGAGGGLVALADPKSGAWNIYAYDLSTSSDFRVSDSPYQQQAPRTDGKTIVWQDMRNWNGDVNIYNHDIYAYDVAAKREYLVTSNRWDQLGPSVSGNIIVWQDGRNGVPVMHNWDIYGYNIATGQEFSIATAYEDQVAPAISGNTVVWMDSRSYVPDASYDIWGKNLVSGQEFPICTALGGQESPAIDGRYVVWVDYRNTLGQAGHGDIYGYDLQTGQEFPICVGPSQKMEVQISGDLVVWMDDRNGNFDIYGAYIPEPASMAFVLVGSLIFLARKRSA
ncbi:MAG: TolB family protein [Phycisphaerae bacterium]